ncbi:MAG: PEGA domain-containing protein [Nitrospiraceae bacterium]|nr:PEGA domain-containing protein [Nitrospiraceae bacterium]
MRPSRPKAMQKPFLFILLFCLLFCIISSSLLYADEYSDVLVKGTSLYEKGDFDKAILEFKKALNILKEKPNDESKNDAIFTGNLYLGMSYLGKGKSTLAKESFKNAFKAAPSRTLSAEQYPPKVISLYNEVVSQNLGTITVKSNSPDAEVFLDDTKKGNAPLVMRSLHPGTYTVKVVSQSNEYVKTIQLAPGKNINVIADFQSTGSISVVSDPSSASVMLDGKMAGVTPLTLKDINSGEHTIVISKPGFGEITRKVLVNGREIADVNVKLGNANYILKIVSTPDNAEVFLDDISKGKTPLIIEDVALGVHKIRIIKDGYEDQKDTIEIKGSLTEKAFRLNSYTGGLNVKTDPPGAEIIMDDKNIGITPMSITSIPAIQHILKLRKAGYKEKEITVIVAKDKISEINEMLFETDTQKPEIIFEPPIKAIKENKNFIRARIVDNQAVGDASLMLKIQGEMNYQNIKMINPLKGIYEAMIPELYLKKDAVLEYYIFACDLQNNCETSGNKETPYRVKIISLEPYTEGFVLDVDAEKNRITISLGTVDNVKKEDRYIVFRANKELRDPKTGELLQIEEIFLGTIKVAELLPSTSYAMAEDLVIPIAKNDRIRKKVSAPSGISTEGIHATKIVLKWSPNREPEIKGYRIFKSSSKDGNYQKIADISGRDNTLFEDSDDMKEGQTFFYKITAYNILDTDGIMSDVFQARTKKGVLPPTDIKADGIRIREVHLVWDIAKQDPDIEKYIIYRAESADGSFIEVGNISRDNNDFIDREGLKDGKTYYYRITGKSRFGSLGEFSKTVAAKTKEGPAPPSSIRAYSGMAKSIMIQWDKHADPDVAGYAIYKNEKESGDFTEIARTSKNQFIDAKGLMDGKKYHYIVASFYSIKDIEILGALSKSVSAETKRRPNVPKDFSAESNLAKKVVLKWNKSEEKDLTEYWIYRASGNTVDGSPFVKVKADKNTFVETDLKDNTKYSYAIRAVDSDGLEGELSSIVSAFTKSLPKPPTGLKAEFREGKIQLKWDANKESDIIGYNIYKKGWLKNTLIVNSKNNAVDIKLEDKPKSVKLSITAVDKDNMESEPSEEIETALQ